MSKYEIVVDGPINLSGMGNVTRGFIKCLNDIPDFKVKVYDNQISPQLAHKGIPQEELDLYDELSKKEISTNALYIQIGAPRIFKKVPFKHSVAWTLFESDGFHPQYVQTCNTLVDEIWTASRFNKHTFSTNGVNKKIRIIPPMIDTEAFKPDIPRLRISNLRGYVFQANFDFSWRKGMDILLHAYWDEFTNNDDVCLIIKTFTGDDSVQAQRHLMNNINFMKKKLSLDDKKTAPVLFMGSFLEQKHMPAFANTCDCYVMASRGEGFGLTAAEAMSLEKQVICTRWSAPIEFVSRNGYMIDLDAKAPLVPIQDQYQLRTEPFYQGQSMANPSIDHLKELMHTVIKDKSNIDLKKKARDTIIKKFSKEATMKRLQENIIDVFEGTKEESGGDGKGLFA